MKNYKTLVKTVKSVILLVFSLTLFLIYCFSYSKGRVYLFKIYSDNDYASKCFVFVVKEDTGEEFKENGSCASSYSGEAGEKITLHARFCGGVLPYEYKYCVKLPGEELKMICDYSDKGNISVSLPSECGTVQYRIAARDAAGKILYKNVNVNVIQKTTERFSDNGTCLNNSWSYVGSSVTVYAKFKGGKMPYRYRYYRLYNGKSEEIGGITESDNKRIVLPSEGEYTVRVDAVDADGAEVSKYMNVMCSYCMPVKNVCQYDYPSLPTGCEITSLACCLNYYGFDVTKNILADEYLPSGNLYYLKGKMYGPDPLTTFVGSPYSEDSFGCYGKCIEVTANKYFKSINSARKAEYIRGQDFDELLKYIKQGKPVIVWATMRMWGTVMTDSWKTSYGKSITWKGNEHCLVLAGFDSQKKTVYVADPMENTTSLTEYSYSLFKQRYDEQDKNAVIIN